MTTWHYLPVTNADGSEVTLCEVYVDERGALKRWTETPSIAAVGHDIDDLRMALANMMTDTLRWKPVPFADLRVGMVFEPAA